KSSKIKKTTKFGNVRDPNGAFLGVNGTPEYVLKYVKSLKRLGIDQSTFIINIVWTQPVAAMAELVKEEKIKYLGYRSVVPTLCVVLIKSIR
ncbi:9569_t:CDS:2, partial [Ambispora leptoticha]